MRHRAAPGVQHRGEPDLDAQTLGIGRDGEQRLGGDLEQQPIDERLVRVGERADRRRQREDHVVILDRQQIRLPGLEPTLGSPRLTLRAVPVAARVVADVDLLAGLTAQHMPAQRRSAALFDGRHDLQLPEAQVAVLGETPRRPEGAEDVRDLQCGADHDAPTPAAASPAD